MILPTKYLSADRALLSIGSEIISCLTEPLTVSEAWTRFRELREASSAASTVSFDWFVLSLNLLFALSAIRFENGELRLERTQ
jgi:hypothetical protein